MFNNKRAVQDNWHKKVMEDPIVGIDVFKFFKHLDMNGHVLSGFNQSNLEAITVKASRTTFGHEAPSSVYETVHGSVNQKSWNYIGLL